ncbi:hypothetical protein ACLB1N_19890 [Escherichia coli]
MTIRGDSGISGYPGDSVSIAHRRSSWSCYSSAPLHPWSFRWPYRDNLVVMICQCSAVHGSSLYTRASSQCRD